MNSKLEMLEEFRKGVVKDLFEKLKKEVKRLTDEDGCVPYTDDEFSKGDSKYKLRFIFRNERDQWVSKIEVEVEKNLIKIPHEINIPDNVTVLKNHYIALEYLKKAIKHFNNN